MNEFNFDVERIKELLNNPVIRKIALTILIIAIAIFSCFWRGSDEEESEIIVAENKETEIEEEVQTEIYIDIDGAVKSPGVYKVSSGTRLFSIIEMAGGLNDDADVTTINRAMIINDGDKVIIPKIGEISDGSTTANANGMININIASNSDLEELPGIGPVTAETIVEYREEHDGFKSIEELMNISGIGVVTFNKVKDSITV
ncbi:MAG: helix-hairpin-helix domain-containing protein [Peptostreptococcaceae bacterium]|nr:helix-hairpin-helix domain-containing protein [Peptostreptococcaceae bacterium]